jgi:exopolysaccharide biosynthesis polyprenyl glycosylphosphotransferase
VADTIEPTTLSLSSPIARNARNAAYQPDPRSRGNRIVQLGIALGDLFVLGAATVLGAVGRTSLGVFHEAADVPTVAQSVGAYIILGWMLVNWASGTYHRAHLGVGTVEYARILSAGAVTAGFVGIFSYLLKFPLSRGFYVLLFLFGVPLLLLWRRYARRLVHQAHLRGRLLTRVLISGSSHHVDEVAQVINRESWLGYRIVGALLPSSQPVEATEAGIPVVGRTTDTAEAVIATRADVVIFAQGAFPTSAEFRRIAWDLEGHPVSMVVVPSLSDISSGRITMRPVGGLPLVYVEQPQSLAASRGLKRTFDLVGALAALLVLLPLMATIAAAVFLHDRGPVLFRQTRVGRDGHLFECLKFRSMVVDAEAQLGGVAHLSTDADSILFKAIEDPRITRVGKFIRRLSIDELPQLVNVLRGEMSLVGPRPALPAEVRRYEADVQRRLHVRPGMTGLWQVSGRSDLSWDDTVRLDLYYVDNWSIVQDLTILVRTIQAVLRSRGAY